MPEIEFMFLNGGKNQFLEALHWTVKKIRGFQSESSPVFSFFKYIFQFGKIQFVIWKNTICN